MVEIKRVEDMLVHIPKTYSIGIHGISGKGDFIEKAESIIKTGLDNKTWGGVLSNVTMLGQIKDLTKEDIRTIRDYIFNVDDYNRVVNVLVAIPETFIDSDGFENFIGHFHRVQGYPKGNDYAGDSLPVNKFVEDIQLLPKHFILGYYYLTEDNKLLFKKNENFIEFQSKENQIEFYKKLKEALKDTPMYLPLIHQIRPDIIERMLSLYGPTNEYTKQYLEYVRKIRAR